MMDVAVVTGAGRGLGRAISVRLSQDGYRVVAVDIDIESAAATASKIGGTSHVCDVADREAVRALADEVGPVAVLVNNAGVWAHGTLTDASEESLRRVLEVNLLGTVHCCSAFVPGMVALGGGAIVNLTSVAAAVAPTQVQAYPLTKGAIEVLTRQLAQELGPSAIRVNAVGPGYALTEGTAASYVGVLMAERASRVPLGRIGTPEDVANAVSFLVSSEASYISGQVLYVDGGVTAAAR